MKGHQWSTEQVKSAKKPNYSKLYVITPALLGLLDNVKGKEILEIGCGDGYWLRMLTEKGAKCTGFDLSENQIEAAKKEDPEKKINYFVADASKKVKLEDSSFDIIFLEHVLLEISEISKIKKIFKEVHRLLKDNGFLVVSDLHPLAPETNFPNVEVDKDYTYFKSGHIVKIVSNKPDGTVTKYTDFHWTFQDLVNAITESGLKVVKVLEPTPNKEIVKKYPYLKYRQDKPLALMIKAQK
jgi:ubiquinone/menaquinone biosynthesis C-methylase UbiE